MKLTTILNEIHGQNSTFKLCWDGYIPLSLPIIKKLVKPKRRIVFHMTDVDHLEKLHRIEGKSKALSSFTKLDFLSFAPGPLTGGGMWTRGGVLAVLSGVVLAENWGDLWTVVDKGGRRWAKPNTLIHKEFEGKVIDSAPKRIKRLRAKHYTDGLTNKEKNEFITGYINTAYKLLLKNRSFFQKKYDNKKHLPWGERWNELVVNKIRIEKIYVMMDYEGYQPKKKQKWALETYSTAEAIEVDDIIPLIRKWGGSFGPY